LFFGRSIPAIRATACPPLVVTLDVVNAWEFRR